MNEDAVVQRVCGWLEESPGVKSSTRLLAFLLFGCAAALATALVWYVWFQVTRTPARQPDAGVIAAMVGGLTAFVSQGAVAIIRRGSGE